MPPTLALSLWLILFLALLWFDPAKESGTSPAMWVPVIWMVIVGSRLPSQWLGFQVGTTAQAFEEGNPLDRAVFFVLILLAIAILLARSFRWGGFLGRNLALVAFVTFSLLSVLWSDFPFVAFKRWFRDLGNYVVILVVLSDPRPLNAVRTLLRRLSYFLIPLSVVLVKYFPQTGRGYDQWTGVAFYNGATTSKNMLGAACVVSGLFFFWDTVTRWSDRKEPRTKRIILVNLALLAMALWLLNLASSATSLVCLVIGCLVLAAAHSRRFKRHPGFLKALIPSSFFLYLMLAYGLDMNGALAGAVGRDPTLTDRTLIWKFLLNMHTNPIVGTGYDSFWLGPRLQSIWALFGQLNEAHNGYLEVYLNLGAIGLVLLVGFLIASYRTICKRITSSSALASLSLAVWTIMLFYDITESAFRGGLLWIIFLLGAIAVPGLVEEQTPHVGALENAEAIGRFFSVPLETADSKR